MVRKLGLCLGSTVAAMLATAVWAQIPQAGAPAAPVPKQIASAKKVFISNMGTDSMSAAAFRYERAENRPYNEFYAAVKAWGRYQLVDSPADADLIYEIGFTALITGNQLFMTLSSTCRLLTRGRISDCGHCLHRSTGGCDR